MDMGMMPLVVECSVPSEILRRDFHLLRNRVALGAEQMHPRIRVVIAQPFRVFPMQRDDVCPDVARVFVHLFLYL